MQRPPKHVVPYGIGGVGKTTLAASMDWPQWIAMFDSIGKETPYTDGTFVDTYDGVDVDKHPTVIRVGGEFVPVPTWDCFAEEECKTLLRRIVWFQDPDNTKPAAYDHYSILQPTLLKIIQRMDIKTFILDSNTTLCVALRNKYSIEFPIEQKGAIIENSARGWANRATDELEWINQFINSLPINTCTICHSFYDTNPNRNQELPQVGVHAYGRMRDRLLITSGDVYRGFVENGEYKVHVTADNLHAGNNSMKLKGIFPNNWGEIIKADQTKVTFVERKRD